VPVRAPGPVFSYLLRMPGGVTRSAVDADGRAALSARTVDIELVALSAKTPTGILQLDQRIEDVLVDFPSDVSHQDPLSAHKPAILSADGTIRSSWEPREES
jgi:hypothetical protein